MSKPRLFALAASVLIVGSTAFSAQLRPALIVLTNTGNFSAVVQNLEQQGARVRSRVPPFILTADLPQGVSLRNLPDIKDIYQSAVPIPSLEPMGALAVATGLQWNRTLLKETALSNAGQFGAMRSLVAGKSLKAPTKLHAREDRDAIEVTWETVAGALYYEVEASFEPNFSRRETTTRVTRPGLWLAAPVGQNQSTLYIRVRAADHGDIDNQRANNFFGEWSTPTTLTLRPLASPSTQPPPQLSSPLNNHKSEGFTLILEWIAVGAARFHVQVATNNDFTNVLFDQLVTDREFTCPSPAMEVGDKLYWRVRIWDEQHSDWSDIRSFRVGEPTTNVSDVFVNPEAPQ